MEKHEQQFRDRNCKFRSWDYFGIPVTLYYKGDTNYRTSFGACCTLILYIAVLIPLIISIFRIHTDWNPRITEWRALLDMQEAEPLMPFDDGFDIAFGLKGEGLLDDGQIDPSNGAF
jgi:hypothetical protein